MCSYDTFCRNVTVINDTNMFDRQHLCESLENCQAVKQDPATLKTQTEFSVKNKNN